MFRKGRVCKRVLLLSLTCMVIAAWGLAGCVTTSTDQTAREEPVPASIEAINVSSLDDGRTVVEILNSKHAPYAVFQLIDPLRVVLDIRGVPASELSRLTEVNDGNVTDITLEKGKAQAMTTRVSVCLARAVDYKIAEKENGITLTLKPKKVAVEAPPKKEPPEVKVAEREPSEPRVFFKPRATSLNQILGVDFTIFDRGKSRLTVTTDKKAPYNLKRKDSKTLVLTIEKITVPPLLLRRLDSSHFGGAVVGVKSDLAEKDNRLSLNISLREMVPFHVDQTDSGIHINFGPTAVKPVEMKIIPSKMAEIKETAPVPSPAEVTKVPGIGGPKYGGARMTMDFVNADVTNILRLIGEVSNLNIIWGPDVKGTVSMRLKNVPWDQALDLVLENNNLGKRQQGNVIWVTTGAKIVQIEAEEKAKQEEAEKKAEAEKEKAEKEKEKAKKEEPLITEYLRVDFADAETDIKPHVEKIKSERGSISVDARTNTVIMTDTAAIVEKAKDIVREFDTTVKQIMIEARIVDASTTFGSDLGIAWSSTTSAQRRSDTAVSFGVPTDATTFTTGGDQLYGGSFSSNSPVDWASNIGLSFGTLTSSGLGALTLNAQLALAETEGKVKIISAPKVIASNGEEATISRGDIIYKEIVTADTVDVKEMPATLSLTVTPTVSFNDYVTMDIEVNDDKVYSDLSGKTEKKIKTKLMVKSGDTVVIGGIYKEDKSESEAGIPFLKDIPLLGWLFKAQKKATTKNELLIFLTPTVIESARKKP